MIKKIITNFRITIYENKSLILLSCISAIALLVGIVAIITEFSCANRPVETESSINSNISHTNKSINNP